MPPTLTYPGVYIEEIPSGVRTITGVATSITAFVGWAARGRTDQAVRITSVSDFERVFGGLHPKSLLGYSVAQFFENGGSDAYVVRIVAQDAAKANLTLGDLTLTAKGEGQWAHFYGVKVKPRPAPDASRFLLTLVEFPKNSAGEPDLTKPAATVESYANLSMNPDDPRFVKEVIDAASEIVSVTVGGQAPPPETDPAQLLANGVDGAVLEPNSTAFENAIDPPNGTGAKDLLDKVDLFNLLCVPAETNSAFLQKMQKFCRDRRAFLIADCPPDATVTSVPASLTGLTGDDAINSAFYFPWVLAPDPLSENRPTDFPPCGFVAGVYARTDATRGVWKAPAGIDASLTGASGPKVPMSDLQNGQLNIRAINCIRSFPVYGTIVWGARTLQGDDERGSEWKYIPVRRTALFIEESLFRALKWVVFEPNDEPLWAQIRLNVGAFMQDLFRKGAFQGRSPREAYFVKCDKETTTQNDINRGVVNILVGFAPLKPAEFVVIKIQQIAGDIQT